VKKTFKILMLIGWFFSVRMEMGKGIWLTTSVGPFGTKAACEAQFEKSIDALERADVDYEFKSCKEQVEA
jgi:hypothetical protein